MNNAYINHIDRLVLNQQPFLFEFSLGKYLQRNVGQKEKHLASIKYFLSTFTEIIEIQPQIFLLLDIKQEGKFLSKFEKIKEEFMLESYLLIKIEKGYIASNWLKRI